MQLDGKPHPVSYAGRALNDSERKYGITELETLAVVWGVSHFHHFLYGHNVTIDTDHTAVRAVLEPENPTAKHARWWTRVYGRGVKSIKIQYRSGRENNNADALSCSPYLPAPAVGIAEDEVQVSIIAAEDSLEKNSCHPLSSGFKPGPSWDQHEFQRSTERNQGLPGENNVPWEQVAPSRCTESGVGPKATIPLKQPQLEAVLLAELPFPSVGDDGDPTTREEAARTLVFDVSPCHCKSKPNGDTTTELSTPVLGLQSVLRYCATLRVAFAPLQPASATHAGSEGLAPQSKLTPSEGEYLPTLPESRQSKISTPVVSKLQTATHSVTDGLENQTTPYSAKESPSATTSAEDQAISLSIPVGQETRWRPIIVNAAQEDGASVNAVEHANGDCYLEYVPRVQCQVQALMDGGNTRPQGTTQKSAPGSPNVPAVLAIDADVTQENVSALLQRPVARGEHHSHQTMITEQAKDPELKQLTTFISHGDLPLEETIARKLALQRSLFTIVEGVLYYVDPKRDNRKRAVVPKHLRKRILEEVHAGPYGAHFSGQRMFSTLVSSWWWERMFSDASRFAKACPECAITTGVGRRIKPEN